jgi:hypothetical protein
MDIDVLRKSVSQAIDDWEGVITELGPRGLEAPNANGEWRVRDVLAHMTGWERWQIVQLRNAFLRGPDPSMRELVGRVDYPEEDHFLSTDERNAVFVRINGDRPLDDVLADFREVSAMYLDWVESASQEDIDSVIGTKFSDRTQAVFRAEDVPDVQSAETAASWLARLFVTHRGEHLDAVRTWMSRQRT